MSHPAARGPRYRQLPLWRDAQRFLLEVELAVRAFPRYHKYTLGSDLRRQAMDVNRLVARAAQQGDAAQRVALLERLVWQVEDMKMSVQLGKELQAFAAPRVGAASAANTPAPATSVSRKNSLQPLQGKRQQLCNQEQVSGFFAAEAAPTTPAGGTCPACVGAASAANPPSPAAPASANHF